MISITLMKSSYLCNSYLVFGCDFYSTNAATSWFVKISANIPRVFFPPHIKRTVQKKETYSSLPSLCATSLPSEYFHHLWSMVRCLWSSLMPLISTLFPNTSSAAAVWKNQCKFFCSFKRSALVFTGKVHKKATHSTCLVLTFGQSPQISPAWTV